MNFIDPTINKLKRDNSDTLDQAMKLLVDKFYLELKRGNIEIKSVNEFTRLANLMLQLRGDVVVDTEESKIPKLTIEDEELMKNLYDSLITNINNKHDEENGNKL